MVKHVFGGHCVMWAQIPQRLHADGFGGCRYYAYLSSMYVVVVFFWYRNLSAFDDTFVNG